MPIVHSNRFTSFWVFWLTFYTLPQDQEVGTKWQCLTCQWDTHWKRSSDHEGLWSLKQDWLGKILYKEPDLVNRTEKRFETKMPVFQQICCIGEDFQWFLVPASLHWLRIGKILGSCSVHQHTYQRSWRGFAHGQHVSSWMRLLTQPSKVPISSWTNPAKTLALEHPKTDCKPQSVKL